MYAAWVSKLTPFWAGVVWWPYSVIQIGTLPLRWNHFFSDVSSFGIVVSATFGQRTTCSGRWRGSVGYGWCATASNLSFGAAFATSWRNLPGDSVSCWPFTRLSRPRAEVSPRPTRACRLPALIPL